MNGTPNQVTENKWPYVTMESQKMATENKIVTFQTVERWFQATKRMKPNGTWRSGKVGGPFGAGWVG